MTDKQLWVVQGLMDYSQVCANEILHVMENHGLDKIKGCRVIIIVEPSKHFTTKSIQFGMNVDDEFGLVHMSQGKEEEKYTVYGRNSPEYEVLFSDEPLRGMLKKSNIGEKPLPEDGMWI